MRLKKTEKLKKATDKPSMKLVTGLVKTYTGGPYHYGDQGFHWKWTRNIFGTRQSLICFDGTGAVVLEVPADNVVSVSGNCWTYPLREK